MARVRSAAAAALAVLVGCGGVSPGGRSLSSAPVAAAKPPRVRTILAQPDAAFWVSRDEGGARVVASGARLELSPSGAVVRAAWDRQMARRSERLLGAIPIAPRLGSGFVHWSGDRLYTSSTFTGPLVPIARGLDTSPIRGARNGVGEILVVSEASVSAWRFGAAALTTAKAAGLADEVSLDGVRAVRQDILGRGAITIDGGRTFRDAAPDVGSTVRGLGVVDGAVAVASARGYFTLREDGELVPNDAARWLDQAHALAFALAEPARADHRDFNAPRAVGALGAAIGSGASFGDGTALALLPNSIVRVELASGRELWASSANEDSVGPCTTTKDGAGGALVACAHGRSRSRGAFVLRSDRGEPPRLERVFRDDGAFVTDGEGALLYTSSCDDENGADSADEDDEAPPNRATRGSVVCARLRGGTWIELHLPSAVADVPRQLGNDDREALPVVAWVPRPDGATALVARGSEPRAGASALDAGPLRVLVVPDSVLERELDQQRSRGAHDGGRHRYLAANVAGGIDAWLGSDHDSSASVLIGAALDRRGGVVRFDPPPGAEGMSLGGARALVASHDGALFETLDGGRHWSRAGTSPIPPATIDDGCTELGCRLGALARIGAGTDEDLEVIVSSPDRDAGAPEPRATPAAARPSPPITVRCTPAAAPEAREGRFEPARRGANIVVALPNGEAAVVERPIDEPSPEAEPQEPIDTKPTRPKPRPAAKRVAATVAARIPFAPEATARTLGANGAVFGKSWRQAVAPLLGPHDEVGWLFEVPGAEILFDDHRAVFVPIPQQRSYWFESPLGAVRDGDKWVVLARARRRFSIEERGVGAALAPYYFGIDRDVLRQRMVALGRRADGVLGVVVGDGYGAADGSVAVLDRRAGAVGPLRRLAPWSTATRADAPECRVDPGAFHVVVPVDGNAWLALAGLPGATIGSGVALVAWGESRVCVEAIEAGGTDPRHAPVGHPAATLIARWAPGAPRASILRTGSRSELRCTIEGTIEARGR